MANKITLRFYSVQKLHANGWSLKKALNKIASISKQGDRQKQLTSGVVARLERFDIDGGELAGEFTRVKTTDFPFEVKANGVDPLQTGGAIGDGVAFRYRPADHTLAMQYDPTILSPSRAMEYIMQVDQRGAFEIEPKMDPKNWKKFQSSAVRKIKIGIASPDHLGDVENQSASVADTFKELGEAYGAPVITIEMGMGHRRGALFEPIKEVASNLKGLFGSGDADLRSLKAKIKQNDDTPAEEVNLIDEVLSDKTELDLPKNNPDRSYQIRNLLLKDKLLNHGR